MLHYYILFDNHTDAMAMYRAIKDSSHYAQISPTPRELSVCCGVSLLIKEEDIYRGVSCVGEPALHIDKRTQQRVQQQPAQVRLDKIYEI